MFTGNDFSLQSIDDMSGKEESVLVAKLDSSANGYLRSDAGNCDSTEWLPHVTLKFGIYVDKNYLNRLEEVYNVILDEVQYFLFFNCNNNLLLFILWC